MSDINMCPKYLFFYANCFFFIILSFYFSGGGGAVGVAGEGRGKG